MEKFVLVTLMFLNCLAMFPCEDMNLTVLKRANALELMCNITLDKDSIYDLWQISMRKDDKLFYYINNNMTVPQTFPADGIRDIRCSPTNGFVTILNATRQTSGNYSCRLFSKINQKPSALKEEYLIIDLDNQSNIQAHLTMKPSKVTKDQLIFIYCNSKLNDEKFVGLKIYKGDQVFIQIDSQGIPYYNEIPGIYFDVSGIGIHTKPPSISIAIKFGNHTEGDYKCGVLFRNTSQEYNTEIFSDKVYITEGTDSSSFKSHLSNFILLIALAISYLSRS